LEFFLIFFSSANAGVFIFNGHDLPYSLESNSSNEEPSFSLKVGEHVILDEISSKNVVLSSLGGNIFFVKEFTNSQNISYYFFSVDNIGGMSLIKRVSISRAISNREPNKIYTDNIKNIIFVEASKIVNYEGASVYFYKSGLDDVNLIGMLYKESLANGYTSLIDFYGKKIGYSGCDNALLLYGCDFGIKKAMICYEDKRLKYVISSNGKNEIALYSNDDLIGPDVNFYNGDYVYKISFKSNYSNINVFHHKENIFSTKCTQK
jgi:hypothetical protein